MTTTCPVCMRPHSIVIYNVEATLSGGGDYCPCCYRAMPADVTRMAKRLFPEIFETEQSAE